jgi:site-specific recombinase XerD
MTLNEAIRIYEGIAVTQAAHAWKSWCKAFEERWHGQTLESIDTAAINTFISDRRKEGKSEGTIKSQLATLRCIFKAARSKGAQAAWPDDIARVKPSNSRVRTYEGNEEARLQQAMHPSDWKIVQLAKSTGLRSMELWYLEVKHVNLTSKFLKVVNGKGRKDRMVPLGPTALKLLKEMIPKHRSKYVVVPIGHDHYENRRSSIAIWKREVWRPALRAAGIEDMTFHDNRHSFASTMARAGKSIQSISVCMGHSSISQTMRYAHLNNTALHDAVSCV